MVEIKNDKLSYTITVPDTLSRDDNKENIVGGVEIKQDRLVNFAYSAGLSNQQL